ncbi:Deoxyhypusine synthase, catalyzes formation of deoxyhypusine [Corchorus olitorius]|uniref:Deoxyhypusine synthase, catalyzes formation of deoxyhypusine n=1 Tax=Corchorus olitorius TaxID=93759 RepID=A0A1R3K6K4_9ROSI|nr:Deoxyhypusine synthase, catalyzes formation of deoxyhypusine [Corchorus olitorius]
MARQMKVLVAIILAVSLFLDFPAAVLGDDLERSNLRGPKPLPEEFIRQNGLDLDKVRRHEHKVDELQRAANSLEGFRPAEQLVDEVLPSQKP